MDKVKILLSHNKLMELMALFSGFQKLLFFFIPIFIFIPCYGLSLFLKSISVPLLPHLLHVLMLWVPGNMWGYLIINSQVHWQQKRKNCLGNIVSLVLTLVAIVLVVLS